MSDPDILELDVEQEAEDQIVLRVLGGRLAGKDYPLGPGQRITIGHSLASDVILRGAGTRDASVELRMDEGDGASLHVLGGRVELLGRTLEAGEEAMLPPFLPFRFGEFVLAHGLQESARWDEARTLGSAPRAAPLVPLTPPSLVDRVATYGRGQLSRIGGSVANPRVLLGGASLVLLVAAVGTVGDITSQWQNGAAGVDRRLEQGGFPNLEVAANPAGGLIVSGTVASDADLVRLGSIVGELEGPVRLDVSSGSAIAIAATDILQAQGIDAEAAPAGANAIMVSAPFLTADRRTEIRQLLSRDLPGLRRIGFRLDDSRGDNALQSFFADSGTGLASVVEDPGHIVTADGARWFPGAVLPTGHRLVSVQRGLVRFEKDGRIEEIRL